MKVKPISSPLPGEHLAGVSPQMQPESNADWRSRLNFWTGRALTENALNIEQENRAASLAWRGRLVASGVVNGLEVALESTIRRSKEDTDSNDSLNGQFIHIMPGYGIMTTGEDVYIPKPLRIELDTIPVIYGERVGLVDDQSELSKKTVRSEGTRISKVPWFNSLDIGRKMMRWHLLNKRYTPWAGVLLLRPVKLFNIANRDAKSPDEIDPSRDAFNDPRIVDASQLLLFMLPPSWRNKYFPELKKGMSEQEALTWRNRVAARVFQMEMDRTKRQQVVYREKMPKGKHWETLLVSDDLLQWEYFGVPIGLIGFEPDPENVKRQRIFLDRNSVVRKGGVAHPRPRPSVIIGGIQNGESVNAGTPSVWYSRVTQFNDHLSDLLKEKAFLLSSNHTDTEVQENCLKLLKRFRYLPPAGILPRASLHFLTTGEAEELSRDDRADTCWFFPTHYSVTAVPVANEEVEALVAASAPLTSYDLLKKPEIPEPVCVLVPMPENQFDSDLLVIEKADPVFKAEVKRLYALRQDWRQRRDFVLKRRNDLSAVAFGGTLSSPGPLTVRDPDQIEAEPTDESTINSNRLMPSRETFAPWKIYLKLPYVNPPWIYPGKPLRVGEIHKLIAVMHLDEEQPPTSIEFQWHFGLDGIDNGTRKISKVDRMPPVKVMDEIIMPGATPQAVNFWRYFEVSSEDLGLSDIDQWLELLGVTITLFGGRAAIRLINVILEEGGADYGIWDTFCVADEVVRAAGWVRLGYSHDSRAPAPFEDNYLLKPVDGINLQSLIDSPHTGTFPFNDVLTELTPVLMDIDPSLKKLQIIKYNDVGLELLIKAMTQEADKATEVVELSFGKVQASLQRLQSVITGETDADEALKSPAVSSMTVTRNRNIVKPQINESMTVNPNWTIKQDIQLTKMEEVSSSLDDVNEMKSPSLFRFTRHFAYGPAYQAYQRASAVIMEVLKSIASLNVGYDNDEVPEILMNDKVTSLDFYTLRRMADNNLPEKNRFVENSKNEFLRKVISEDKPLSRKIAELQLPSMSQLIIDKGLVEEKTSGDIVAKGIHRADVVMLILRKVEYYITRRRQLINKANIALSDVKEQIRLANFRLITLNGKLSETRHDLAVARTLWQEELNRVDVINARRDELITTQVKQLVYIRPRSISLLNRDLPSCELDRKDAPEPIPVALMNSLDPPDELENYLQLFRNAPAVWFCSLSPRLREINTRERLMRLLEASRQNAQRLTPLIPSSAVSSASERVYASGYELIKQRRIQVTSQIIMNNNSTWDDYYRAAVEHVTLGDLMDGAHGCNDITLAAAQELNNFSKVSSSLHAEFSSVQPGIRMVWVELYSQFDHPAPLHDIAALPRSESLSRLSRKRFQAYIDWIFSRIDKNENGAVNLVNDLVRMCLLLASYAPVNRLITGHVPRPMPVFPGLLIPVQTMEPHLVRIGMQVKVWHNNNIVAKGTVENLHDGEISARILETHSEMKSIETGMRIQFISPVNKYK